ncbi:uncharacterized protein FOMMEDRAFT_24647 [Fomitiporia mediterranea MF3/22]|uniref:uncharacterized protein n=1 Tax=Fomitiporia mediterranea (strain MF3/22) TaxID=694068 RepID=UPI0004409297|nr:uncharacterized protein FOMMEDRAFT_24647 [Fomitiporia mediterranea MF3/22]EJD07217.1 hypothetical protein FOMMEDRAFT_24647 [Fomitiporia mediterranea MF3/22]
MQDAKPTQRKLTRHSEFWFSDGSVVLLANDVLFRVHKSFLARHSLVFRDVFSLPQPSAVLEENLSPTMGCSEKTSGSWTSLSTLPEDLLSDLAADNGEATLDGCPVVPLHDSPDDVASLLYALYDGPKFDNNSSEDFRVVSGILRLASKYEIDGLRSRALEHLSVAWPATLKGWDAREEFLGNAGGSVEEPRFYPNPVEVINLAREVNAPNLLPSAFYDLSRYPLEHIFQNSQGSIPALPQSDRTAHTELSLTDTQRLALGKETSHCAVTALIRSLATEARSNPSHHTQSHSSIGHHARGFAARHQHRRSDSAAGVGRCASPATCWRDVCELVDLATQHYLFDRERGASDPLYVAEELALLKSSGDVSYPSERSDLLGGRNGGGGGGTHGVGIGLLDEDLGEAGTCRACSRAFEVWATKERERLWRAIPGWFKLDQ